MSDVMDDLLPQGNRLKLLRALRLCSRPQTLYLEEILFQLAYSNIEHRRKPNRYPVRFCVFLIIWSNITKRDSRIAGMR